MTAVFRKKWFTERILRQRKAKSTEYQRRNRRSRLSIFEHLERRELLASVG